jgi:NADH dehydrogenase
VTPAALAAACRARGCRLVHVSALGLDAASRSGFLRSKRAGETALRASEADWYIVRPSLLDGAGGFGASWLRRVARWPVHPLPADATGRIAVLDVSDLGEALAELALRPPAVGGAAPDREFDLGGPQLRNLGEHLAALRHLHTSRPAWRLWIPGLLARLGSHFCDLLQVTPYSFGHWELLRRDNCPQHNRLPELLGRAPRPIGVCEDARVAWTGPGGGVLGSVAGNGSAALLVARHRHEKLQHVPEH